MKCCHWIVTDTVEEHIRLALTRNEKNSLSWICDDSDQLGDNTQLKKIYIYKKKESCISPRLSQCVTLAPCVTLLGSICKELERWINHLHSRIVFILEFDLLYQWLLFVYSSLQENMQTLEKCSKSLYMYIDNSLFSKHTNSCNKGLKHVLKIQYCYRFQER